MTIPNTMSLDPGTHERGMVVFIWPFRFNMKKNENFVALNH